MEYGNFRVCTLYRADIQRRGSILTWIVFCTYGVNIFIDYRPACRDTEKGGKGGMDPLPHLKDEPDSPPAQEEGQDGPLQETPE